MPGILFCTLNLGRNPVGSIILKYSRSTLNNAGFFLFFYHHMSEGSWIFVPGMSAIFLARSEPGRRDAKLPLSFFPVWNDAPRNSQPHLTGLSSEVKSPPHDLEAPLRTTMHSVCGCQMMQRRLYERW